MKSIAMAVLMTGAMTGFALAQSGHSPWTRNGAPTETYISGGPWTLEQSGAANGLKSAGYCTNGVESLNPAIERMQPYYFPFVTGKGKHLQGYFDWRPKDTNEAVVAASSDDAGLTWNFQQKLLELRPTCPTQVQKDPDGDKDNGPDPNNSDNGDDDGQGHAFVLKINGHTYLYTLERANGHIDSDDLYIHEAFPAPGLPLNGVPAANDGPTDATSALPEIPTHTYGLINPDGILGVVPGRVPTTIIYEEKILNGDNTGSTAFPAAQQCNTYWAGYYASNPFGTSVNDDITYLRLAETTDGIHFTDKGVLNGLNDPTDVSAKGTRWLATAGTILKYDNGKYGLFYSSGSCLDGDSDAFHFIGYAESKDLKNWTVINGVDNPILSTALTTITLNAQGVPSTTGTSVTFPATLPVAGNSMGWFYGRVYGPHGAIYDNHNLTILFAGYHTPKPKNGLGDYRTIGRISLHIDRNLLSDDDEREWNDDHEE